MNVTTQLRMPWMSYTTCQPEQKDFKLGRWWPANATPSHVSGYVTASIRGSKASDGTLPHSLRSKASVMAPWTKEDAPADLLGSWWVYSPGSRPSKVVRYNPETGAVTLECAISYDDTDVAWLLTAYTRVPAPTEDES